MTFSPKDGSVKDTFHGTTSLVLSLGFFIPLFNIGLCAVSIWFAIRALRLVDTDPKHYGGRTYAIIGLVLSITTILVTIIGIIIYGVRKIQCGSVGV